MKRRSVLLMAALIVMSLTACGKNDANDNANNNQLQTEESISEETKVDDDFDAKQAEANDDASKNAENKDNQAKDNENKGTISAQDKKFDLANAIEGQVFDVNFDVGGNATFALFFDEEMNIVVTLRNDSGIFYKETINTYYSSNTTEYRINAVSFEDIDMDGHNDIVILTYEQTYWEHVDQTFEENEVHIVLQDFEKKTFAYSEEYSEALEYLGYNKKIEDVRKGVKYLHDEKYEKVEILSDDQIKTLTLEEKAKAFMEGKIKILVTDYSNKQLEMTLHDMMKGYQKDYLEFCSFPNIKPRVSYDILTAQTRQFIWVHIYCELAPGNDGLFYILADCGDHLENIYSKDEAARYGSSFYDGLLIYSGGSCGASHHAGELEAIDDECKVYKIYDWEEQTLGEWNSDLRLFNNYEWNINDIIAEEKYNDSFIKELMLERTVMGDNEYWVIQKWNPEYDSEESKQDFLDAKQAIMKSNYFQNANIVTEEELFEIEKEYAKTLGFTLQ